MKVKFKTNIFIGNKLFQPGEYDISKENFEKIKHCKGVKILEKKQEITATNYNSLKVDDLKNLLEKNNIDYPDEARKADLVKLVEENLEK